MAKLGLNHGLHQRQDMVLAPRMLQAIEVLALPGADLEGWLMEQAEGNEALVVETPRPELSPERGGEEPSRSRAAALRASDDHHALLEAQPDRCLSLSDTLEEQLATRELGEDVLGWVHFLVDCLDPAGLLTSSDEELMDLAVAAEVALAGTESGWALLGQAIGELQQLEPAGIGARSSVEALLLQLDPADQDYALLCSLLEDFLFELSRNRRPSVAAKLGLELGELDRLLGVLGQLETRPAAHLTVDAAPIIQPDVMVHRDGDRVSVELVRGLLPSVTIDPMAEELLGSGCLEPDTRGYLRGKVDRARSVAEAVEMRGVTLLRVAEGVIRRQPRFMSEGLSGLRPLSMTELAAELELAPSTISRAVAGKSLQTPFGILPLRQFFQSSTSSSGEGGAAATEAVRIRVKHLVEGEDPSAPLSDEAIVEALGEAGLAVARRTVAKYRKELGIPSSYQRKRHA